MQPLLQNLVEMTAHRDHLRLEISVLSTLFKLNGVVQVRALELFAMPDGRHCVRARTWSQGDRSEEHTSELQSQSNLVCRLLLEKKKKHTRTPCTRRHRRRD